MMLDWLGEADMAARLEAAVAAVIAEGKVRTYDMGGTATTMEMARGGGGKLLGGTARQVDAPCEPYDT